MVAVFYLSGQWYALVVGLFQMAGADRLTGAGARLHLLPVLGLLFVLWLFSSLLHLLGLLDLSDLLARRWPDVPALLSHQSLRGSAQILGRGHALSLDPLDMVNSVRPLLELAWVFAYTGFIGNILPGWIRKGFVGLQLALMTHGRGAADDENHDDEKRGHNNNNEQILLQEIHNPGQDEVFQTDHGSGYGVGEVGRSSGSGDGSRSSSGERYWKKQFQFCFITTAIHGYVVEKRSGVTHTTPQREEGHTGDKRNQARLHLLFSCNNNNGYLTLRFKIPWLSRHFYREWNKRIDIPSCL